MSAPILIDTNLCILLVVGLTNKKYIKKHKRLDKYDEEDFNAISRLIGESGGILLPPNVISETSNMVRYLSEPAQAEVAAALKGIIGRIEEAYIASSEAVARREYSRLGITDAVLLVLAEKGATLLTDDFDLYLAAARANFKVINYNHMRELRADFRR